MKIIHIFLLLVLFIFPVKGQSMNLNQVIDFDLKQKTLEQAFKHFEKVTQISLAYDNSKLSTKSYSWTLYNTSAKEVLENLLKTEKLSYKKLNQQILIYKKAQKVANTSNYVNTSIIQNIILEGKIQDNQTKEAIPFAHLIIEGTSEGTAANANGVFRLVLTPEYVGKKIIISSVGYKNASITISKSVSNLRIDLEGASTALEEIVVDSKEEKAIDIVKEAIANIPQNYPTENTLLKGYYRELTKTNGQYTKFADAACEIFYTPYGQTFDKTASNKKYYDYSGFNIGQKKLLPFVTPFRSTQNLNDKVKIIEARASDNLQRYQLVQYANTRLYKTFKRMESHDIGGGPIRLTRHDYTKNLGHLFNEKILKKYKFEIKDYTLYNGHYVYLISFRPKGRLFKKEKDIGNIVIDEETKAILRFTYHKQAGKKLKGGYSQSIIWLNKKERKELGIDKRVISRTTASEDYKIDVEYFFYENKVYLKRIQETTKYINSGKLIEDIAYQTSRDLIINDLQTTNVNEFSKEEIFRTINTNYLFAYPLSYNPEFWKTYPYALSDDLMKEALQDLEKTHSLEAQFQARFTQDSTLTPPVAKIQADTTIIHQDKLVDNYAWLRNKYEEEVEEYLEKENKYTYNYMISWRKLQRKLYYEMVDKTEKNYESIPTKIEDYYYGVRFEESKPHEIYYRKKGSVEAEEEIILDVNELAKNHSFYYAIEDLSISPNHKILAYTENTTGGFDNMTRFKNLADSTIIADSLQNIGSLVWANDNKTIFYTKSDSSKRTYQLYKHIVGTNANQDLLVYQENDPQFTIGIGKSRSKKYIYLNISSKTENETHILFADKPDDNFKLVQKRQVNQKYYLYEYKNDFFVASNTDNPDFDLYRTSQKNLFSGQWNKTIAYASDTLMSSLQIIGDYMIISERINMKPHFKIIDLEKGRIDYIQSDSTSIYQLGILSPDEGETEILKYSYSSPISPRTTFAYNMTTKEQKVIKKQKVNDYKKSDYTTERIYATAQDGTKIPITLVYKKGFESEERKLHLTSYGAYGIGQSVGFRVSNLPFLDRGGIVAYAHIRGGREFGNKWYEQGKLLNKKNTFTDFIACAELLIEKKYAQKGEIIASGGSAGGLLMGNIINARPELFKIVIFESVFVDLINTMLDETLPLTTEEYKEWGNPKDPKYYEYMKSYSPYDNVKKQNYPHILFTAGYNDDNVGYWESAKMVAKLRAMKQDDNTVLLKTDMYSGHTGGSGRYAGFKDQSFIEAFIESVFAEEKVAD